MFCLGYKVFFKIQKFHQNIQFPTFSLKKKKNHDDELTDIGHIPEW